MTLEEVVKELPLLFGTKSLKETIMNLVKRAKAPTPKFFKVLRNIGLVVASVSGVILTAPVALPAVVTTIGGYFAVAGGVVSAVSQLTTIDETPQNKSK
jgi:uncharacterized membrane protein HdeD (DUF308 family)